MPLVPFYIERFGAGGSELGILIASGGCAIPELGDDKKFKEISKRFSKGLIEGRKILTQYGTANLVEPMNAIGCLPVRNFSMGFYAKADSISAQKLKSLITQRGGKTGHACQHGLVCHSASVAGRILGVGRIPAVRGQGLPAYDPRGLKGNGVTYLTSQMGADHTTGNCLPGRTGFRPETSCAVEPKSTFGQVDLSYDLQIMTAVLDILGFCLFVGCTPQSMDTL